MHFFQPVFFFCFAKLMLKYFFVPGWFYLNKSTIQRSQCNFVSPSWSLVHSGYWPGSPTDTSYVFDQQLFHLWDTCQKRMPGTSESSFIRALEDVSVMKGGVWVHFLKSIIISLTIILIIIIGCLKIIISTGTNH